MDRDIDTEVAIRLLDFVDRMADLVGVCDEDGRVLYLNETARKYLGFGDIANLTTADFFGPDVFQWYYDEVRPSLLKTGVWTGDLPIRSQAGDLLPMSFSVVAGLAPGGEITGLVTHGRPRPSKPIVPDEQRPTPDVAAPPLDRAALVDWTRHALARAEEDGGRVALVNARVRGLRRIISIRGKFVADGVMRAVGRRLTNSVRVSDVVARVGQDTFVLVFENMRDVAEVLRNAGVIQDMFEREPIWTASGEEAVSLTLGLAISEPGDTAHSLLERATGAALEGESDARRPMVLGGAHDATVAAMTNALRRAVTAGEIRTYVRPVVGMRETLVGYEAWPRWSYKDEGTFESHELLALAERIGVAAAIDLRVLREATAVVATSPSDCALRVYVPLSEALLTDVYVEQYVWEIADAASVATDQLYLLIRNQLLAGPGATSRDTLQSLRETGCHVVVTDVDEHADIPALLGEHHAHEIRFAEQLVLRSYEDAVARFEVERLAALARERGASVCAPGVDTAPHYAAVREMGVDLACGDFFGEALPTDAIA